MKIFLSYPMAGKLDYEMDEIRRKMVQTIMLSSISFIDFGETIEIYDNRDCHFDGEVGPLQYLGEAIKKLDYADMVCFGPGWDDTRGCRVEYIAARNYDIEVMDLDAERWHLIDFIELNGTTITKNKLSQALDNYGIWSKEAFANLTEEELLSIPGIGRACLREAVKLQEIIAKERKNGQG